MHIHPLLLGHQDRRLDDPFSSSPNWPFRGVRVKPAHRILNFDANHSVSALCAESNGSKTLPILKE